MYVDYELLLDSELDIGGGLTSQASTNVIDLGVAKNVANGRQLYVVIVIDETFAGGTHVIFHIVTDTTGTITPDHYQMNSMTFTSLTAGQEPIVMAISETNPTKGRYLGLWYEISGTFSAGKVTAFVTLDPYGNEPD